MSLRPSEIKELAQRTKRFLREKGRPFSGGGGYSHGAEADGLIAVRGDDYSVHLHLSNPNGGFGRTVYSETRDGVTTCVARGISEEALEKLRAAQVLDDLASI